MSTPNPHIESIRGALLAIQTAMAELKKEAPEITLRSNHHSSVEKMNPDRETQRLQEELESARLIRSAGEKLSESERVAIQQKFAGDGMSEIKWDKYFNPAKAAEIEARL